VKLQTAHCHEKAHRDICIEVADAFASTAEWLISYFETEVASGTRFEANQTVEIGWSLLLLRESGDCLEVWEPDFDAMPIRWCLGVNNTLRHLTLQRSVCQELNCEPVFPSIRHAGAVSPSFVTCDAFTMSRDQPANSDSGWVFREEGYAGSDAELVSLYQVALQKPTVIPFVALPENASVHLRSNHIEVSFRNLVISSRDNSLLAKLVESPSLV
jgi:hypothetical protein